MKTFSIAFTDKKELLKFIIKNRINDYKNILVQIFTGNLDENFNLDILQFISNKLPQAKIIGTSTDGEIQNAKVTRNTINITFSCFENTIIKSCLLHRKDKSDYKLGQELANNLKEHNSKVFIVFSDGLFTNGENLIRGISDNSDVIIAGGMAGDNGKFKKTFVFDNNEIIDNGVVGVSLNSDNLIVNKGFGFNWQGIGKIMTITKAKNNIVYEIDGKKAVDVYRYYFGDKIADALPAIGIEFPLILKKDIEIARAVIAKNDDGSLVFAGNLAQGDKVQFGFGNVENILLKSKELIKEYATKAVESIFIYSCMARRRFLSDKIHYEIEPFAKIADVNGFFTYGEFFKDKDSELFNETMTILSLSETNKIKSVKIEFDLKIADDVQTLNALTHLVNVSSKELMELNKNLKNIIEEKIQKIKLKNKQLEDMFYYDLSTHLPNKNAFEKDIAQNSPISAILLDIRNFSSLNDMYGESIGDEILQKVAFVLNTYISKNCKLYQVGVDQFIIINFDKNNDLKTMAKKIQDYLHSHSIEIRREDFVLTIEIFLRVSFVEGIEPNLFKIKADMALNHGKKIGKSFIEYSNELQLEKEIERELKAVSRVRKAIKTDNIIPVFQKIVKTDGNSFECLVRIKENDELISPFFFLESVFNTTFYYEITKIMIKKSFEYFKNRDEEFSINFSFKDIEREEIVSYFIEMIEKYNLSNRVIVELLESENINNLELVSEFIQKVRKYGVKIAIDDFGSGYSNFVYLASIKPDFIKIDGSLIKNIDKDEKSLIIVKNINNFAKDLGSKVIAEFVHSKEVYEQVKGLNIYGLQGYYLSKPKEIV